MSANNVYVFSENAALARELLNGARTIADAVGSSVVFLAIDGDESAEGMIKYGADTVKVLDVLAGKPLEAYVHAIIDALDENPKAILIGATAHGKPLAGLLSATLSTGCSAEIRGLSMVEGEIQVTRMKYGGAALSTDICTTAPHVITATRMVFEMPAEDASRTGEVLRVQKSSAEACTYQLDGFEEKSSDSVDLTTAKKIICIGRGVKAEKDLEMFRELAEMIGAELGCTAPVAKDNGWFGVERYIGLSGKTVKPQLYFIVGSSGQIQHMAGVSGSKIVLSVNHDPVAPVFNQSDYSVVANLYDFMPAFIAELKGIL